MKSKSKILHSIALLGCSLLCANAASSIKLDDCDIDTTTGVLNSNPSKHCFNLKDKKIYDNTGSAINTIESIYYFSKSSDKIESTNANSAGIGYSCSNANGCTLIETTGLYEATSVQTGYYYNVYNNNNALSYQLINYDSSVQYSVAFKSNGSSSLDGAIILCKESKCEKITPKEGDVFIDGASTDHTKVGIIKCTSSGCNNPGQSEAAIFLNAGNDGKPLIECTKSNDVHCVVYQPSVADKYYINGASSKSVIYCSSTESCELYTPEENSYFVNEKGIVKTELISCSGSCSVQEAINNGYYLTKPKNAEVYSVIKCTGNDNEKKTCVSSSKDSNGFYKNADENTKATHPLISCTSKSGCASLKLGQDILPGYYVDVSVDGDPVVLVCTENACNDLSLSTSSTNTYNSASIKGNYVFTNNNLQLVVDPTNKDDDDKLSSNVSSTSNEEALYYFIEISDSKGFPGIATTVSTLFKVSKYYIARVVSDGIIYVSDSENKITSSGTPGAGTTIYSCSKSKKTCSLTQSCTIGNYFLDSDNSIGYYCNAKGSIEQIKDAGYYIDSGVTGTNTKYLIQCESDGNGSTVCTSLLSSNYFVNAGSDNSTKPLIYCNGIVCRATAGTNGYYLSGVKENGNNGIIKCTSSTSCSPVTFNNIRKSEHYYLNSGGDKLQRALIRCKGRSCNTIAASDGYFITDDVSSLIYCENPTSCSTIAASAGYYNTAVTVDTGKKIIECSALAIVTCEIKDANPGYYVAKTSNVLINCNVTPCKAIIVTNGIFRSATTQVISSRRDTIPGEEDEEVANKERATTSVVYNIISCTNTGCNELSTSELSSIPVCTFNNNKCFINNKVSISTTTVSAISAGSYCTNSDRSVIYFATDTVVIDPEIIDGTTSIYTYTTTTTNCIEALDKYSDSYYTVGSSIYKISDGSIIQLVSTGYYFINVDTNTLVSGNNIENYNNESVKLFKCNDNSCSIIDKPENAAYYADVNKRIIMYNPNSDSYNFAYENEVICVYSNNKCTPRADIKNMEFCITYKGELCLVTNDIKSRETGECYKADSISSKVYGLSQYMYQLNAFAAERIVDNAYYVVSMSTNSTATIRDYAGKNNSLKIYGCVESKCDVYEPEQGVYYYDNISRYMFRYEGDKWVSPQAAGYALVSTNPGDTYINRFSLVNNRTTIDGKVRSGYYYTIDKEMYECDQDKYQCEKIDNSGYYFTVSGEIYQCVYDSEGIEATECIKKNCVVGQYYYINAKYYYCSSGYMLNLVSDKTCEYDDKVIVNFPVAFSESYPDKIKSAVENIALINNSTALVTNLNSKYVTSVSAVYTNCTYTVEEKESEFDLVCVNNFVAVNNKKDVQICSLTNLGYTECIDDENNPEKCNPSGALSQFKIGITLVLSIVVSSILLFI